MYWKIGERIVVEEQDNKECAEYGKFILKNLGQKLSKIYGSAFSEHILRLARQFYQTYLIQNALRFELNWMQYRFLIRITDEIKREYYELRQSKTTGQDVN